MPWRKLPINQPVYTNVDDVSLSGRTPERHDTFRNNAGATVRRPGFSQYFDLGTAAPVDGLYNWEEQSLIIAVSGGNVYKKTETGDVTTLGSDLLLREKRPTFANFGDTLYTANGGDIVKITSSTAAALTDANIPDNVTHVAAFDTYLLANEGGTGRMHYSDVLDPETWSANFVTAEQAPDDLMAIHTQRSRIFLVGTRTIEAWYNDGVTPFVPINGGVVSTGTRAPHTIQWIRDSFYWLNEHREVARSAGQSYEVLSSPVADMLVQARTVSDAIADYQTDGGKNLYVLSLPSYGDYGKTIVYDVEKNEWQGEWNYWDSTNARYERYRGNCYVFVPAWNKHLIGDKSNGLVYYIDFTNHQDNGATMRSAWLTGNIDHGTGREKISREIRFRVLRGEGSVNSEPELMIRWRDNGNQEWGNTHYLGLGKLGDYDYYVSLRRLGKYRSRQYELSVTDDTPVTIADAEEMVEVI